MVDWFPYFLHPERLQTDFGGGTELGTTQRAAAVEVLQGLLGSSNFRSHILSSYPSLRQPSNSQQDQAQYTGPTPPSTPRIAATDIADPSDGAASVQSIRRAGQCTHFTLSLGGLPNETLAQALQTNMHAELSARQTRLLDLAADLDALVHFRVEEVERSVHATLRFVYFLHVLGRAGGGAEQATVQFRRWTVRAAYREEEIGLALRVDAEDAGLAANERALEQYAGGGCTGDPAERFAVTYDLARLAMAQGRYGRALERFVECQRVDAARCRRAGFVVGAAPPSVDEYVAALRVVVEGAGEDAVAAAAAETPTGPFGGLRISRPGAADIATAADDADSAWLAPLAEAAGLDTLAEGVYGARDVLVSSSGGPGAAVALVRAAHAYVAGLRQLERARYAEAHAWFLRGHAGLGQAEGAAGGDAGERERAVRAAVQAQLAAHAELARALEAATRGAAADAWVGAVDRVLAMQTSVRFEFLEPVMLAGLGGARAEFARVVAAVGTQQKLYQQLPDVHMAVLQAVSLLAVVRDALDDMRVDAEALLAAEEGDAPEGGVERLRAAVGEIARLAVRIPQAEVGRVCRGLGDAPLMALVGVVLAETAGLAAGDSVQPPGPWALGRLAQRLAVDVVSADASADQRTQAARHLHGAATVVLRWVDGARPSVPSVLLGLWQAARALDDHALAARALVECTLGVAQMDPVRLDACVRAPWFATRTAGLALVLRALGHAGAAAVLLQLRGAQRAVPALVEAWAVGGVHARTAAMLWDPSVVEYAEYLARARGHPGFGRYDEAAVEARPLKLAALFAWLAAELGPAA